MGTLLAGIFGIALILLVLGLGWQAVWKGIMTGAEKAKATLVRGIGYFLPGQQIDSQDKNPRGFTLNNA